MKYYEVKKEFDNFRLPKRILYVENELFTESEVNKYGVDVNKCKVVNLSKRSSYFFFGARFNTHQDKYKASPSTN